MLDEQHGQVEVVAQLRDERAELRDLLVVEAAGRLVEQQQARLGASARASSTRFSVPNGSPATGGWRRRRCRRSRGSRAPACRSCRARNGRVLLCAPTRTLSSTVIVRNSSTFWNVRAIPRRTTRCGGVCRRLLPSNSSSPESGRYSRVITLKSVVLPAPFGPIRPTIWPGSTSSETSSMATIPPNRRVTFRIESSATRRV